MKKILVIRRDPLNLCCHLSMGQSLTCHKNTHFTRNKLESNIVGPFGSMILDTPGQGYLYLMSWCMYSRFVWYLNMYLLYMYEIYIVHITIIIIIIIYIIMFIIYFKQTLHFGIHTMPTFCFVARNSASLTCWKAELQLCSHPCLHVFTDIAQPVKQNTYRSIQDILGYLWTRNNSEVKAGSFPRVLSMGRG